MKTFAIAMLFKFVLLLNLVDNCLKQIKIKKVQVFISPNYSESNPEKMRSGRTVKPCVV